MCCVSCVVCVHVCESCVCRVVCVCEGLDLLRGSPAPRASVTGPICWEGRSVARGESGCKEGKGSEG